MAIEDVPAETGRTGTNARLDDRKNERSKADRALIILFSEIVLFSESENRRHERIEGADG